MGLVFLPASLWDPFDSDQLARTVADGRGHSIGRAAHSCTASGIFLRAGKRTLENAPSRNCLKKSRQAARPHGSMGEKALLAFVDQRPYVAQTLLRYPSDTPEARVGSLAQPIVSSARVNRSGNLFASSLRTNGEVKRR